MRIGLSHGEKPMGREESFGPAFVISTTRTLTKPLSCLGKMARRRREESVNGSEEGFVGMFEALKPAFECRIEIANDTSQTAHAHRKDTIFLMILAVQLSYQNIDLSARLSALCASFAQLLITSYGLRETCSLQPPSKNAGFQCSR